MSSSNIGGKRNRTLFEKVTGDESVVYMGSTGGRGRGRPIGTFKKRPSKFKKGKKSGLATKAYVQSVWKKKTELKHKSHNSGNITYFNPMITAAGDFLQVCPRVQQGNGANTRDGNKIYPTSLKIEGDIWLNTDTHNSGMTTAYGIIARMFLLQDKARTSYEDNINNYGILDHNGAASFTGLRDNINFLPNFTDFDIYEDRRFKFDKGAGVSGIVGGGMVYNPGHMYHFSIVLKPPSVLEFDDLTSAPKNWAPYLTVGWVPDQGDNPTSTWQNVCVQFCSTLYFRDA